MPGGGAHLAPQGQAAPPKPPGPRRQCRLPVPSAPWRRAPAPRAGGGRAALRFGWGGSGSRRRQAHEQGPAACKGMRWATLPCPAGARGRCRCAGSTLFAPAGQKRFRVGAPDFGGVAGESRRSGRFAHQVRQAGAPGDGEGAAANIRRGNVRKASYSLSAQIKVSVPPLLQLPVSPAIPRGERRGPARTRSRDSSLENPFLGTGLRFPAAPSPQNRRRRQAPALEPAAVYSLYRPQPERNAAHPSPTRGVGCAPNPSQRRCQPARPAGTGDLQRE